MHFHYVLQYHLHGSYELIHFLTKPFDVYKYSANTCRPVRVVNTLLILYFAACKMGFLPIQAIHLTISRARPYTYQFLAFVHFMHMCGTIEGDLRRPVHCRLSMFLSILLNKYICVYISIGCGFSNTYNYAENPEIHTDNVYTPPDFSLTRSLRYCCIYRIRTIVAWMVPQSMR